MYKRKTNCIKNVRQIRSSTRHGEPITSVVPATLLKRPLLPPPSQDDGCCHRNGLMIGTNIKCMNCGIVNRSKQRLCNYKVVNCNNAIIPSWLFTCWPASSAAISNRSNIEKGCRIFGGIHTGNIRMISRTSLWMQHTVNPRLGNVLSFNSCIPSMSHYLKANNVQGQGQRQFHFYAASAASRPNDWIGRSLYFFLSSSLSSSSSSSSSNKKSYSLAGSNMRTMSSGRKQVNFGQGVNQNRKVFENDGLNPAQRKAAELQLQTMEQSTKRILERKIDTISSHEVDSFANEIRVAIHFWSNKWIVHFHPFCSVYPTHVVQGLRYPMEKVKNTTKYMDKSLNETTVQGTLSSSHNDSRHCYGDYGARVAEELLHLIIQIQQRFPQYNVMHRVLAKDGNVAIANIIYAYLLPCTIHASNKWHIGQSQSAEFSYSPTPTTTSTSTTFGGSGRVEDVHVSSSNHVGMDDDFTQFSTSTGSHNIHVASWNLAIQDACRVIDTLEELVANEDFPIQHDTESNNAMLYCWMKLAMLRHICTSQNASMSNGSTIQSVPDHIFHHDGNDDDDIQPKSLFTKKKMSEVVHVMEDKLKDMENAYFAKKCDALKPNIYSYNYVLRALTLHGSDSLARVKWYLRRMEKTEDDMNGLVEGTVADANNDNSGVEDCGGNYEEDLPPTTVFADSVSYNLVINSLSSSISDRWMDLDSKVEMAREADLLLERAETRYRCSNRVEARPTTITYANVLKAWANAERPMDAERILQKMITLSENSSDSTSSVKPNLICFNTVVNAWAKTKGRQSADNALRLMEKMEELSKLGEYRDVYPDTITYSSVISAFARSGREDAGCRAEELLERSINLYHDGKVNLRPDSMTFCSVLDALAKQSQFDYKYPSRKSSIKRAEEVFERMKQMHLSGNSSVRPNTVAYNILIGMYATAKKVEDAENLFQEMQSSQSIAKPDLITYNSYLYALANSDSKEHIERAISLLNDVKSTAEGDTFIRPDTSSYMSVMKALARKSKRDPKAIQDMQNIVRTMENRYMSEESTAKPINVFYNCYIDALVKSGSDDAFDLALETIDRMKKLSKDWDSKDLLPDTISYTILMNALANQRNDTLGRAEDVLKTMEAEGLKPNRYTYNSFINCLARSREEGAPERAEEVLTKMWELSDSEDIDIRPDVYTFASVINCWAHSNTKYSAERAQRILDLMESRVIEGEDRLRPTLYIYGAVLNAWAKSGHSSAPQRALVLLERIERRYIQGDESMRPNGAIYNAVINAIAKSNSSKKAQEAEAVLQRMRRSFENGNHDAKPNSRTLSTILNACAYTNGDENDRRTAFNISRRIFKEIINEHELNQIIFATFLKCCVLIPPSATRSSLVVSIFNECRHRGMVDVKVLLALRRCLSREESLELLRGTSLASGVISIEDIPHEWRNTVQKNLPQIGH